MPPKDPSTFREDLSHVAMEQGLAEAVEGMLSQGPHALSGFISNAFDLLIQHGIGVIEPRIGTIVLAYKVARAERNLSALKQEMANMSANASLDSKKVDQEWTDQVKMVLECTLDAAIEEREFKKIRYLAQLTVSALTTDQIDSSRHEDFLTILRECTLVDLLILEDVYTRGQTIQTLQGHEAWMQERNLPPERLAMTSQKMLRLGLFYDSTRDTLQAIKTHRPAPPDIWGRLTPVGREFVGRFLGSPPQT